MKNLEICYPLKSLMISLKPEVVELLIPSFNKIYMTTDVNNLILRIPLSQRSLSLKYHLSTTNIILRGLYGPNHKTFKTLGLAKPWYQLNPSLKTQTKVKHNRPSITQIPGLNFQTFPKLMVNFFYKSRPSNTYNLFIKYMAEKPRFGGNNSLTLIP